MAETLKWRPIHVRRSTFSNSFTGRPIVALLGMAYLCRYPFSSLFVDDLPTPFLHGLCPQTLSLPASNSLYSITSMKVYTGRWHRSQRQREGASRNLLRVRASFSLSRTFVQRPTRSTTMNHFAWTCFMLKRSPDTTTGRKSEASNRAFAIYFATRVPPRLSFQRDCFLVLYELTFSI